MQLALEWATANHPEHSLKICTDSQSLLKAIECRSPVTHHLRSLLNARPGPKTFLCIPRRKGIPGNVLADTAAKTAATTTSDPPRPISYASVRSLIRRILIDPPTTNLRTAEVYGGFSWSNDCMAINNRVGAVLLACLRADHTPLLKAYAYLLDLDADPLCPLYKEEPQKIEHWLRRRPRLDVIRQNTFGSPSPLLKILTTHPERVLALARVTL